MGFNKDYLQQKMGMTFIGLDLHNVDGNENWYHGNISLLGYPRIIVVTSSKASDNI